MFLFGDSFGHYATAEGGQKYNNFSGTIGANGLYGNAIRDPNGLFKQLEPADETMAICGARFKWRTAFTGGLFFELTKDGNADADRQIWCRINAGGTISVMRGLTELGLSTWAASLGTFYYIQFKVVLDDTDGSAIVRVKEAGSAAANILNITGVDTQNTASQGWNGIRFANGNSDMCDLYVCDGSGSVCNDFLGDIRADTLAISTDAVGPGTNHTLTPSTGTDHGALVDESTPNGDTDYNSGDDAGEKDTYQVANTPSGGAIYAVQLLASIRKTDHATKQAAVVVRTLATDYDGDTVNAPIDYSYARQVFETNPSTLGPWTHAQINAPLQAGAKVVV